MWPLYDDTVGKKYRRGHPSVSWFHKNTNPFLSHHPKRIQISEPRNDAIMAGRQAGSSFRMLKAYISLGSHPLPSPSRILFVLLITRWEWWLALVLQTSPPSPWTDSLDLAFRCTPNSVILSTMKCAGMFWRDTCPVWPSAATSAKSTRKNQC